MDAFCRSCLLLTLWTALLHLTVTYNIRNHPCCIEPTENLTLAMIIDAFEIYGHDPTDKLDNLWLYQNEMLKIKTAEDQYMINERIHIASDHLGRFINTHIKELKVLLITLDDVIDNMLTMYENHNAITAERKATYNGGPVPQEFYISQEYYCGKNVYIFLSQIYSDIYNLGRGVAPYCRDRSFIFLGFLHYHDEQKYYLLDDPSISFPTDNYIHGLECHVGICVFRYDMKLVLWDTTQRKNSGTQLNPDSNQFKLEAPTYIRFPMKKILQKERDVITLPKAIVKCGLVMYKLPPLTASSCIIASGSFILDFNIQGLRYRHHDFLLMIPNGKTYYTKEETTPLVCHHHVCEWNYTNHYGGPFIIPGDPGTDGVETPITFIEPTPKPAEEAEENITVPSANFILDGCLFMYPPNYGSIAGKSYLDPVELHDDRFTCNAASGTKGLYWYPQWMGALPHHPYTGIEEEKTPFGAPGPFYPHQNSYDRGGEDE